PEEEAERLDEGCVTDDRLAEALAAAENDLVDAYVRGELSGEERERFETHYLSSERRRDKVLFARALRDRIEGVPAVPAQFAQTEPPAAASRPARAGIPAWALAAAALLLLAPAGYLLVANGRLREELCAGASRREVLESTAGELRQELARQRAGAADASGAAPSRETIGKLRILPLLVLPEKRGASSPPAVTLTPDTDVVALQLRLEPGDESPQYEVTVKASEDG